MSFNTVYFLTNGTLTRSYIGATKCCSRRFRQHALKHKAGAKYTKTFEDCHLWVKIEGFPTYRSALSYEWFAKRKRLNIHQQRLPLEYAPHQRLSTFFAPLLHDKFKAYRPELTVSVRDPDLIWSTGLAEHYQVRVVQLKPPFKKEHMKQRTG